MYKRFTQIDWREKRIYMAGLSFLQMMGYKTAREYCENTVLAIFDVNTDEILFFSNSIDRDLEHVMRDDIDKYHSYIDKSIDTYVDEEFRHAAHEFFSQAHLRESFNCGLMCESIEYPCHVGKDLIWIRACYELEQDEDSGRLVATVVLIDVSRMRDQ
ncbi:MAG: hypothetical protein IJ087_14415 [Eggerthellaceae bacterium]|nr:hypothetical protein [Eggerthellaceae bacterium]